MDREESEDERVRKLLNANNDAFTIDLTKKELYDIKIVIEELRSPKRQFVSTLNLADNHLMELNIININTLITLRANKNCLRSVILDLPALQILDLTNNSLQTIPTLFKMTRLDQVYLRKNLITNFDAEMLPHSITVLDVSENLISLTNETYPNFIKSFKRFTYLTHLVIDKNEFTLQFSNYLASISSQCPRIKTINHIPAVVESVPKRVVVDNTTMARFTENLPKFADLQECVESARRYPPSCQTQLNLLMKYSELLEHAPEDTKLDQNYLDTNLQRDFFEQVDLLHSNQPMYRTYICIILTRLCYVKGISEGAMAQLINFIKSSKSHNEEIQPIISDHIIKKLAEIDDVKEMPIHTLDLLAKMAREVDINRPLSILIEKFTKYITENKRTDDPRLYKLVMCIIACSVRNSKINIGTILRIINAERAMEQKDEKKREKMRTLFSAIRRLFTKPKDRVSEYDREGSDEMYQYIHSLEFVMYCSRNNHEAATLFCKDFYSDYLSELETSLSGYERLKSEDQDGTNIEAAKLTCEIFALEIDSFSCVFNTKSKEAISSIFSHPKRDIIKKVFGLSIQARVDPKILAAICRLALQILSLEYVLNSNTVSLHTNSLVSRTIHK